MRFDLLGMDLMDHLLGNLCHFASRNATKLKEHSGDELRGRLEVMFEPSHFQMPANETLESQPNRQRLPQLRLSVFRPNLAERRWSA
jgi:hypothetical protein